MKFPWPVVYTGFVLHAAEDVIAGNAAMLLGRPTRSRPHSVF